MADATSFDIFEWYPAYQTCQKYFLDKAQYDGAVHAVAALINILLPFQKSEELQHHGSSPLEGGGGRRGSSAGPPSSVFAYPMTSPTSASSSTGYPTTQQQQHQQSSRNTLPPPSPHGAQPQAFKSQIPSMQSPVAISLIPYIRRLVVTGFDTEGIMHGFFGGQWRRGVGPLQECERRNYLFTAKSVGWAKVKDHYDMGPQETVPFLRPMQGVKLSEIEMAEKGWSSWLAMEDWMVGPRAPPEDMDDGLPDGLGFDPSHGVASDGLTHVRACEMSTSVPASTSRED